jgi:hypothetical protein
MLMVGEGKCSPGPSQNRGAEGREHRRVCFLNVGGIGGRLSLQFTPSNGLVGLRDSP